MGLDRGTLVRAQAVEHDHLFLREVQELPVLFLELHSQSGSRRKALDQRGYEGLGALAGEPAVSGPGGPPVGATSGAHVLLLCFNRPLAAELRRLAVGDRLRRLIVDEGVEPASIAVVSTRTLKNSPFAGDRRAGDFGLVNLDDTGSWTSRTSSRGDAVRQVVFDTLDRFKGLERDVVLLLDLPGGDRAVTAHHRYVAASRAKNLLVVVRPAR